MRTVAWLMLVVAVGCATPRQEAAAELPQAKAEARAVGALMTLEEMREATAVLPEENAWPHYEKAHAALVESEELTSAYREAERGEFERLSRFWVRETATIGHLREDLKRPGCDHEGATDFDWVVFAPTLADLKQWARLLLGRSPLDAAAGRPEVAVQCLKDARTIQRHALHEQGAISVLVAIAIGSSAVQTALDLAERRPDDAVLLNGLRSELAAHERMRFQLRRVFQFDSSMTAVLLLAELSPTLQPKVGDRPGESPIELAKFSAWIIRHNADAVRALPDGDDPVAVLRAAQAQEAKWAAEPGFDAVRHDEYGGSMLRTAQSVVRYLARARIAQTVVDMLEARHRDGAWPAKPPVERTDPFDGKPLRWRTEGETVTAWSDGPNGLDDDGERRAMADVVTEATYRIAPKTSPARVSSATR